MEAAHALATKNLVSLSEQELVDCVNGGADTCTVGGEMYQAFEYVISAGGEELESSYPYSGTSGNTCKFDKSQVAATISSYANVTSGDESALQSAVAQQPVSIAIDASSIWFQLYSSGVYDDSSCKNDYNDLDHGVLAAGYGHDTASGKDYWVVKNSWGAFWGQSGYIYMVRNKNNQCGVATDASYPIV
jgi:cathepsin L